jgi:hypothetical protein
MEKRATRRHPIDTSIVCRHLNAVSADSSFDGTMKNCSICGLYAEVETCFQVGVYLVIRVTGGSWGYSKDEGFQSMAVAEVKWTQLIPDPQKTRYATGMKYVIL